MPSMLPGTYHELTATVDHIVPISRGGGRKGDNTTLACALCNHMKKDLLPQQWAEFMMANPGWWLLDRTHRKSPRRSFVRPIPMAESLMILREGKQAWREWKRLQAVPVQYSDPNAQAAFEGAYAGREHLLRAPPDL